MYAHFRVYYLLDDAYLTLNLAIDVFFIEFYAPSSWKTIDEHTGDCICICICIFIFIMIAIDYVEKIIYDQIVIKLQSTGSALTQDFKVISPLDQQTDHIITIQPIQLQSYKI